MKVVVPAAGKGTRLGSLTDERPKGLVSVAGRPLLSHVFETAIEIGASEIVVVIGEDGEQIRGRYGHDVETVPLRYVEQPQPRGLGDAVRWARDYVDQSFVVLNGDNVFVDPISRVIENATRPAIDGGLLVEESSPDEARETGVVVCEGSTVIDIVEKPPDPPSTIVTTGCAILPLAIFPALELARPSDRGELELAAGIDLLIAAGYTIEAVTYRGRRVNVNRPEDIEDAERLLAGDD